MVILPRACIHSTIQSNEHESDMINIPKTVYEPVRRNIAFPHRKVVTKTIKCYLPGVYMSGDAESAEIYQTTDDWDQGNNEYWAVKGILLDVYNDGTTKIRIDPLEMSDGMFLA
jgi:hypothetical protein